MVTAEIPLPAGTERTGAADLIVVHAMAEYIDTEDRDWHAVEYLRHVGLSAHAFVTPSGVVIRSVPDDRKAWHAKGRNATSLGIEFLVPGLHTYSSFLRAIREPGWCKPQQFAAGCEQIREWVGNRTRVRIQRHSDLDPQRKEDPGDGFDWANLLEAVGQG